ncbi:hypothetical protein BDW71DRAFT_194134 [Aspergillus fruticulosus]
MPTRSTRAAPATAAAPAPESAPKRRASARVAGASTAALKKQKHNSTVPDKSVKSTAKRSKYFKTDEAAKPKRKAKKRAVESEDDFIAKDDEDGHSSGSDSDFWHSEVPTTAGRKAISQTAKDFAQKRGTLLEAPVSPGKKELWREGVKTGLGPGKEVFIKKPKARDPGDIPYTDDTLHPNTMLFLKDLAKNNERQWLKAHDADYRVSKKDWDTFVETLTEKVIEQDSTIPELPAKDLVFRIYRDIRFSKDPTPSRTGKKGPYAAYYVHCQPGASFVGSGLWHPEADKLALLREDIDGNSQGLKTILREEGMRREIFDGIPDDEDKAVEAFVSQNSESALKTKPKVTGAPSFPIRFGKASTPSLHIPRLSTPYLLTRNYDWKSSEPTTYQELTRLLFPQGYEHDNENIQLLRLRSFTVGKRIPDADLVSPDAQDKIATLIGIMEPFCPSFLSKPSAVAVAGITPTKTWSRSGNRVSRRRSTWYMHVLCGRPANPDRHAQVTYLNSVVMPDAAGQGNIASDLSEDE